ILEGGETVKFEQARPRHAIARLLELGSAREHHQGFVVTELDVEPASRTEDALLWIAIADACLLIVEDYVRVSRSYVHKGESHVLEAQIADGSLDGLGFRILERFEHVKDKSHLVGAAPVVLLPDGGDRPFERFVKCVRVLLEGNHSRAIT